MDHLQQMLHKYVKMYYDYAMAEELRRQEEIKREKSLPTSPILLSRQTKATLTLS